MTTSREGKSRPEIRESAFPSFRAFAASSRFSITKNSMPGKFFIASAAIGFLDNSGKIIFIP